MRDLTCFFIGAGLFGSRIEVENNNLGMAAFHLVIFIAAFIYYMTKFLPKKDTPNDK